MVTTTRHESGDIEFDLHNGSNQSDWICAKGFLRSGLLILELEDDDNQTRVACEITESGSDSAFGIGLVMGYHRGLTRASDTDKIDQALLKQDSDIRLGREVGPQGPDWGALYTRLNCTSIILEMLGTLHPDWEIRFSDTRASTMSMPNKSQLDHRIMCLLHPGTM